MQPEGSTGLVIAPSYPMLRLGAMETILGLVAQAGIAVAWNKSEMELKLLGNRRIIFRSADNPDRLRGANVGWIWMDEVAMMDGDIWPTAIATLRHQPGIAWATTTPRGKNWVYELWMHGGQDYGIIESPTTENTFLPAHFVDTLRQSMTSEMYRQEVQGQFTDPMGQLFRHDWFHAIDSSAIPQKLAWHRYWDLAMTTKQSSDYTASALVAIDEQGIMYIKDVMQLKAEYPEIRQRIIRTAIDEPDVVVGIEEAVSGYAAVQEIRRVPELASTTIRGIKVDKDKQSRAMPWAARAEAGKVCIARGSWNKPFLNEVTAFPEGEHDDMVDAVSGALQMISARKMDWWVM